MVCIVFMWFTRVSYEGFISELSEIFMCNWTPSNFSDPMQTCFLLWVCFTSWKERGEDVPWVSSSIDIYISVNVLWWMQHFSAVSVFLQSLFYVLYYECVCSIHQTRHGVFFPATSHHSSLKIKLSWISFQTCYFLKVYKTLKMSGVVQREALCFCKMYTFYMNINKATSSTRFLDFK